MGRHCCVPKCTGKLDGLQVSKFSFPKDPDLVALWIKNIGRPDVQNLKNRFVCSKHFESHYIIRYEEGILKGKPFKRKLLLPRLQKGAYPTIFTKEQELNYEMLPNKENTKKPTLRVCCVPGCKSFQKLGEDAPSQLSFFRFPKDEDLRKQWQERISHPDEPPEGAVVCIQHFSSDSLVRFDTVVGEDGKPVTLLKPRLALRRGTLPARRCADLGSLHYSPDPYTCPYCPFTTHLKPLILSHLTVHANERPFKCPWCSYSTVSNSNFTKHKQDNHPDFT